MTKKKNFISIFAIIVFLASYIGIHIYIIENAEYDGLFYDEASSFFDDFITFGRANYGGFDETRSSSIPEKSCYLEMLDDLYGKEKCTYAENVKKITLYSNNGERDSSWQIEANVSFSEAGDTIHINSYYQEEMYEQKIMIYNGNLLEKEVVYNINKKWHYGRDYYYDEEELIKIIDWDSSFVDTEAPIDYRIESYTKDLKRKEHKQIVHGYLGLHSIVSHPLILVHPIEFMTHPMEYYTKKREQPKFYEQLRPYEMRWVWSYDDTDRLIEKNLKNSSMILIK
ncbi:MAG: hypothetical protein LBC85_00705 [Fibromonadaceae bacterium]|jgi:hypothetical protein|nr:hypothetical protein [Fibromonadaceae bacterium]